VVEACRSCARFCLSLRYAEKMTIVFLFGAGASYGSSGCYPECPPLGNRLFPELLKKRGIAATFDEELRRLFDENFEKGMARFIETRDIDIPVLLREMGEYFLQFEPSPDNLYVQLVQKLSQRQTSLEGFAPRIVLATTNYELLLEHAVIGSGGMVMYPNPNSEKDFGFVSLRPLQDLAQGVVGAAIQRHSRFANVSRTFSLQSVAYEVLKLHGSCNFFPNIPPETIRRATFKGIGGQAIAAPAQPLYPPEVAWNYLERSDASIAPAIAMYAEGKRVLFSGDYVLEHQKRFQSVVEEANKIFLIGIRIWRPDTHIWDHLAESKAWLGYVGFEPDEFHSWCTEKKRTDHHFLARSFKDALPHIEQALDAATS
jgi:hypothetical protein